MIAAAEGQLISKGNISVFNSSKKRTWNFKFYPSLLGQKYFVRFLEELKKTKWPFEIIWPLVISKILQILDLQPWISKVFFDHQNNYFLQ